jgi:hypothetical protein
MAISKSYRDGPSGCRRSRLNSGTRTIALAEPCLRRRGRRPRAASTLGYRMLFDPAIGNTVKPMRRKPPTPVPQSRGPVCSIRQPCVVLRERLATQSAGSTKGSRLSTSSGASSSSRRPFMSPKWIEHATSG